MLYDVWVCNDHAGWMRIEAYVSYTGAIRVASYYRDYATTRIVKYDSIPFGI